MQRLGQAILLIVAIVLIVFSLRSHAEPEGPDSISRGSSERKATQAPIAQQAQAGNITALTITATQATRRWQGFYGNITGNVTLDDASGNSMYRWELAAPRGEIYAVNDSITPRWSQVICFNFSSDAPQNVTLSELEASLGMGTNDADGVNETFNLTFTGSFSVGTRVINALSGCSAVSLFVNDAYSGVRFNETILTDNTSAENVIYVSLLENDQQSFRSSETADFQMIVGENGDAAAPSNYYFYVELT
jgi:hypothetical protein